MDFDLSSEQQDFQKTVRQFVDDESCTTHYVQWAGIEALRGTHELLDLDLLAPRVDGELERGGHDDDGGEEHHREGHQPARDHAWR